MPQPLAPEQPVQPSLRFYLTPRQGLGVRYLLAAFALALLCFFVVLSALRHGHRGGAFGGGASGFPMGRAGFGGGPGPDDDDSDPASQVDTIYLGGPDEAPTATRPAGRPSTVHPFVVVQLPRSGEGTGQIPDTVAGHLLYRWLATFNDKDAANAAKALPIPRVPAVAAAQVELRKMTGGFTLLSAKEVQPGVLVFRLHDQTPAATEFLGTLEVRPKSVPAAIESFSLCAVSTAPAGAPTPP